MTALRTEMGSELRGLNDQQQRKIHRRKYYHETMSSLRTITSTIWQIIYQILGHFTSAKTVWRGTEQTSWTALQWRQWDPRPIDGWKPGGTASQPEERVVTRHKASSQVPQDFPCAQQCRRKEEGKGDSFRKRLPSELWPKKTIKGEETEMF